MSASVTPLSPTAHTVFPSKPEFPSDTNLCDEDKNVISFALVVWC